MEKNSLKKAIYKMNPDAKMDYIRMGNAYYTSEFNNIDNGINQSVTAKFIVPVDDMGTTDFEPIMAAKLLLRWLE